MHFSAEPAILNEYYFLSQLQNSIKSELTHRSVYTQIYTDFVKASEKRFVNVILSETVKRRE